ncbi:MAG: sigma-70 family RNA polymerase sigma factor [Clostridia bacterium]|nr:sigma-70 family RNA polymerase sigma factor [Clostridia bacterium]
MQTNEEKLIKRAVRGDSSAFSVLMAAHERQMYGVCLRMFGERNVADAQDGLQEAMIRVWRAIGRFEGKSAFSTWVYRITVNACLDELRRRKSRPATSMDQLVDDGWTPKDTSAGPEQKAIQSEKSRALKQAVNELPEDMRAVIMMRDIDGYSYEEIADVLGINVGTVKSRISRARGKLRQAIMKNRELFDTDLV